MPSDFSKISISSLSRFHLFDVARALNKKKNLKKLFNTYPYFITKKWIKEKNKIKTYLLPEILTRLNSRFLRSNKIYDYSKRLFINWQKKVIDKKPGVYLSLNGYQLEIYKTLKDHKFLISDNGSAHPIEVDLIRSQESKKFGMQFDKISPFEISNSLSEYEICDLIQVPSNFAKKSYLKHGIDEKKLFLNNYGVDTDFFNCEKIKEEEFIIVFCGGITLRKGIHYLIKSFNKLNIKKSKLFLIGPIDSNFLKIIKNDIKENIYFLGPKNQNEIIQIYRKCSLYIQPSIEEGLALSQLQAMSCKLPLLCNSNTGGEDIITEGIEGYTISPFDINVLSEYIKWFYLNREKTYNMGLLARKKVLSNYTWDHYGLRLINQLKKLC